MFNDDIASEFNAFEATLFREPSTPHFTPDILIRFKLKLVENEIKLNRVESREKDSLQIL